MDVDSVHTTQDPYEIPEGPEGAWYFEALILTIRVSIHSVCIMHFDHVQTPQDPRYSKVLRAVHIFTLKFLQYGRLWTFTSGLMPDGL